uniref:Uncharacterized protein n=1 Tax=Glossina palpalis gambiensis TaxID=67801 RepID=A0A1B0B096_9MUSC
MCIVNVTRSLFETFSKVMHYSGGSFLSLPSSSYSTFGKAGEEKDQNYPVTKNICKVYDAFMKLLDFCKISFKTIAAALLFGRKGIAKKKSTKQQQTRNKAKIFAELFMVNEYISEN